MSVELIKPSLSEFPRRPGKGWAKVGMCWDHISGLRLHPHGVIKLPCGTFIHQNIRPWWDTANPAIRIAGGRRRGLMIWALWVLGKYTVKESE